MIRRSIIWAGLVAFGLLAAPGSASAGEEEEILGKASYADMTTYSCHTPAKTIYPGQNLNNFGGTSTCPNPVKLSGPGESGPTVFGSSAQGYITRFKPSMVELLPGGGTVTPSVYDLHLHHVVWIRNGNPTFASGEEKTEVKFPQGYGFRTAGNAGWILNDMIHNLGAEGGRQVYLTWEIDWVPVSSASAGDIDDATIEWLDVAGINPGTVTPDNLAKLYPVFDAERGFDGDGDGKFVFPDDVENAGPSDPGYEEKGKMSDEAEWEVPSGGRTLVFGAGHLHPGGLSVDLEIARDGDDPGTEDGDDPSEVKPLFHSSAEYYEPAGAVSWDVSLKATRPDWRIAVKAGDTLSIDTTYDVEKASWYESMGILPLAVAAAGDPAAKDPFDDAAAVQAMYDAGGILTHGRLQENIDAEANVDLGLADPRKLKSSGKVTNSGIDIDGFKYQLGGYSAFDNFPSSLMRPPLVKQNKPILFNNLEATFGQPDNQQVWHSITSCKAPCNRGSGIGYPLANGPVKFDSGQLGYGTLTNVGVTTGTNQYLTPGLPKAGKTYTYFCRIHPFMRGSVRVKKPNP
jgi:plastocyanin